MIRDGGVLTARLAELTAAWAEKSDHRNDDSGYRGFSVIRHRPAFQPTWRREPFPQQWAIVYFNADGSLFYVGACIGNTKAAAIRWLLGYARDWGMAT